MSHLILLAAFDALQSAVRLKAVSAVKSTVETAAAVPGAPVAPEIKATGIPYCVTVPAVVSVDVYQVISPIVQSVPLEPLERVCMIASNDQLAVIDAPPPTPDVRTLSPVLPKIVPDTPPHLSEITHDGVAVVPYCPQARNLNALPSCKKFAGIVVLGTKIVSEAVEATVVPDAVAQATVSLQN
jgi:hypothetical protein